jgi:hypothetical protein
MANVVDHKSAQLRLPPGGHGEVHPALWSLLPEKMVPDVAVPAWPQFMRGCIRYRQSLDEQASGAPRVSTEFRHDGDT